MKKKTRNNIWIGVIIVALILGFAFYSSNLPKSIVADNPITCSSNQECYDASVFTPDSCVNPGTLNSYCDRKN
jgi:hypothetical protein